MVSDKKKQRAKRGRNNLSPRCGKTQFDGCLSNQAARKGIGSVN